MDMTSVWVAEHGWCYLNATIDCCTREIPAWALDLRCRKEEALAVVERGVETHGIESGQLVLGTDNGTAFTSRGFRARLRELEIAHRRGGYRDPESQAFALTATPPAAPVQQHALFAGLSSVGATGFEPATARPPAECAPRR